MNKVEKIFIAENAKSTEQIGSALAKACGQSCVIYLSGDIGAGKTTFARGFIQGFGYKGTIKSPTYTLVEPYHFADVTIFHFDLYRLVDPYELELIGIRDYFAAKTIQLIEWAENGQLLLPKADLICSLTTDKLGRKLSFTANSMCGKLILQKII